MSPLEDVSGEQVSNLPSIKSLGAIVVAHMVRNLRFGALRIALLSGVVVDKVGPEPGPDATLIMERWRAIRRMVTAGDIGFAEGYLEEDWTTPDLTALIRLAVKNGDALSLAIDGNQERFDAYRGSIDFIRKYVFPGGFLPSDEVLRAEISEADRDRAFRQILRPNSA
ncbi:class I SAM-dependent methyltransferase [Rhizobium leguminosarum]|uniref:class I SAM-dependent methyltransferase n=1 Tax=Rhizobium leguminosarum TaxID=384 RepID=UPI001FED848E|nr:class I SAM-dependent methyltransferase [Rhizobium leguminosarum]